MSFIEWFKKLFKTKPRATGSVCPECGQKIFTDEEVGYPDTFIDFEKGDKLYHSYCLKQVKVPKSRYADLKVGKKEVEDGDS